MGPQCRSMLAACACLVVTMLRRCCARGQDDCRPGQRNSGKNQSAGRPAGTGMHSRAARHGARARPRSPWRRRCAPSQSVSCGSHAVQCLGKPMGCLRCLRPLASTVAAGSVPSVLQAGHAPSPRRWQGTLCDVTCRVGCESIAAGFVWSSGNTRWRESILSGSEEAHAHAAVAASRQVEAKGRSQAGRGFAVDGWAGWKCCGA